MDTRNYQKLVINIPAESVRLSILHLSVEDQNPKFLIDPNNFEKVFEKGIDFIKKQFEYFNIELPSSVGNYLSEVFTNAFDAFAKGSKEQFLMIKVVFKKEGTNFIIKISDNGAGFSDKPKSIFFNMENVRPSNKEKGKYIGGLGIGLANLNKSVKAVGGNMFFKNRKQAGASVYLSFPTERIPRKF